MTFSIVTPSYNQAAFIEETLASVRTAAHPLGARQVEHIIMDGGSTDGTLGILKAQNFAEWVSEKDRGQTDAINKGFARSTGAIMGYLCSDDLLEPSSLERVAEAFQRHPEVDVVYGDYYFLEGATSSRRLKSAGSFSRKRLLAGNFISQPATFWRRAVWDRYGGFDESLHFCMDYEYWLRISEGTRWHYIREPLAAMRMHADSKTCSQLPAMQWEAVRMARRYGGSWPLFWRALRTQLGGQYWFWAKRRIFRYLARS